MTNARSNDHSGPTRFGHQPIARVGGQINPTSAEGRRSTQTFRSRTRSSPLWPSGYETHDWIPAPQSRALQIPALQRPALQRTALQRPALQRTALQNRPLQNRSLRSPARPFENSTRFRLVTPQRVNGKAGLLAITLGVLAVAVVFIGAGRAVASGRAAAVRVYTVREGDTLWSIARTHQPEGDVRPLVRQLHGRHGALLQPGVVLVIDQP